MQSQLKHSIYYRFIGPSLVFMLMILTLVGGCHRNVDSHLLTADSLMEEHPDSALMILEGYELPANTSDYDRAFYGLLLTHARYKNFIDETDDSLINVSVDYFIRKGDKEEAARSLFLKGMININTNNLGDAAVAFTQGLDLAHEKNLHLWEGFNSYGLYTLYNILLDGSSQVYYGKKSYEAFSLSGDKGWRLYSNIVLAKAYNNNFQYDKSVSIMDDFVTNKDIMSDTFLLSEAFKIRGVSLFGMGKYSESIESYARAYQMNNSILTAKDKYNIQMALYELGDDNLKNVEFDIPEDFFIKDDQPTDAFVVLAHKGNYKEAYESLERYKDIQDSLFSKLLRSNVSETVAQYEGMKNILKEEKIRNERMLYCILFMGFAIICIVIYWRLKERIHKEYAMRLKTEAGIQSLKADLLLQLENANMVSSNNEILQEKRDEFISVIRQRYSEANTLCDNYYQGRFNKDEKAIVANKIHEIVKGFTDKNSLNKIGEYVDENSEGLYTSFTKDFYDLTEDNQRLFLYLLLGLNSRTISVIFGQDISAIYNKKSRLKSRIAKSQSSRKDLYLKFF